MVSSSTARAAQRVVAQMTPSISSPGSLAVVDTLDMHLDTDAGRIWK
jgi:hypothetical protein